MGPYPALLLFATLCIAACVLLQQLWDRRRFARAHGCQPVANSHSKDPFLGLDALPGLVRNLRQRRLLDSSCELFRRYGNTWTDQELNRYAIVTIEPENIKSVLSPRFDDYIIGYRLQAFRPLLGQGIFDTDGHTWASSRALIRPSFTRDRLADLDCLESLFQDLLVLLPSDGEEVVDLQSLFFRYTLDSATEFLFGRSAATLKGDLLGSQFADSFHYAQKAILLRGTLGPLKALYRDRYANECYRTCRSFAKQFVDDAILAANKKDVEVESGPKRVFSHELAARTTDPDVILDEVMNVLVAGRDTTASLLGNMFFMLARCPDAWKRLREEVAFLNGRVPSYQELRQLRFVRCCINECKS
jgi:cytochrome P450